ncbi:MAG: hypothetical protein ACRC6M_05570 [Microcystaceae cyanobacterium]
MNSLDEDLKMTKGNGLAGGGDTLTVGNVVTAGVRIYRDHFKAYYIQALLAYVWVIVPVYGWAKSIAIQGAIARLAFHEVIERPETVPEANLRVKPRLWSFLLANILVSLIFFGVMLIPAIVMIFLGAMVGVSASQGNPGLSLVLGLILIILTLVIFFGIVWLVSRLAFVDLAIAIESITDPSAAISRSWKLTQGYVVRLQIIFFVAFLITLPTAITGNLGTIILGEDNPLAIVIDLTLTVFIGALLIPFWQSIKAVIFYDLKSRKEGFELSLTEPTETTETTDSF